MLDSASYGLGRTHEPALVAAVAIARPGPVLELGAGHYSTPLLHGLCAATGRELLTIDGDDAWIERFTSLRSPRHRLVAVPSWDAARALTDSAVWAVIFVDHAPAERRIVEIERLADRTEFMVVHDSEAALYGYEPAFGRFRYRYDSVQPFVQATFVPSVAMGSGEVWPEAISVTAPPVVGTELTVPAPELVQKTLVPKTASMYGKFCPVTRGVTAPPTFGTLLTVPSVPSVK